MAESKKTYDAYGNELHLQKSDFEFKQANEKIHDSKFETKATTFAKDAFKRFCKNKSSVVGAFIIGVLVLMSILVPMISPYDIDTPNQYQAFLEPKVFETGTGFWDGTKVIEKIVYDPVTEGPAGYENDSVVEILERKEEKIDTYSQYATGGTYIYSVDGGFTSSRPYDYLQHYTNVKFNSQDGFNLAITFENEPHKEGYTLAEYQIVIVDSMGTEKVVLQDWSTDYSDVNINISEKVTAPINGKIRINAKQAEDPNLTACLLIKNLTLTTTSTDEELINLVDEISITDANQTKNYVIKKDIGYWQSTGVTDVYDINIVYLTFVYDTYEAALGRTKDYDIGGSMMTKYIENGWCEYDFEVGPESFKVLDDRCPIEEIYAQSYNKDLDIYNLTGTVQLYKVLGYEEMPKFIVGTNAAGFDLFKQAFRGLRTSLALSVVAFLVCFLFGLCWGSISGYFGGNVDLFMERFCDILGGVPWIVVMTLAIVLLGNNLVTFGLALCLTGWMGTAARTRTQFYRFKGREYILSSRTLGASDGRLIFKHILPNAMGTIVTGAVLMIPSAIFSEATLSYLNLGLKGTHSFGTLLSDNQMYLSSYPVLILFPAVIISLIMISFNLFGNGLRDALNPSLKGSE